MTLVSELIDLLYKVLCTLEHKVSEGVLLQPDNYGKFCVMLNEIMPDVSRLHESNTIGRYRNELICYRESWSA